jgi:dynein light intermediate chain 1
MANTRSSNFPVRRPNSSEQEKEEIWKPMLDNISSGKRLPEKSLLVLGRACVRARYRGTC